MANGDAAAAAGMDVVAGTADRRLGYDEINKTRDYIAQRTTITTPVSRGGTGATTATSARTNLSVYSKTEVDTALSGKAAASHTHAASAITSGTLALARIPDIPWSKVTGEPSTYPPSAHTHTSLDSGAARFGWNAAGNEFLSNRQVGITNNLVVGLVVSNLYALNNPVSTGYSSLYVNSDGRFGATPSARRYKRDIKPHSYTLEQLARIQLVTYRLKAAVKEHGDQAPREVGVIAEQLIDAGLSEFVIFNSDGETQSVAYERLALVALGALQELAARHDALEQRVAKLEETLA